MTTKNKRLPFSIIVLAVSGDVLAMNQVLQYYEPYIIKLAQIKRYDGRGNVHSQVAPDIQRSLETKLIVAVTKFTL
ncbi:helix-turn-helix domain-containing protein [Enterococcus faecalis]|uniref:helix-turn-helix domain-containing protein n=1 Tax=Enterococcus faecalis TaxID=1351 RepID=UPI001AD70FAF|nr:helix-turn-helix domain-containing protein [Enterococcus faecalis]MBO6438780.1 helix-turn-helix domain-containing protein [Enterococcus faecalis]MBO6453331.1 helix-turn-helix domain-containing protein [Enterococcus faecalis]